MGTVVLAKEHTAFLAAKVSEELTKQAVPNNILFFSYAELFYNFPSIKVVSEAFNNVQHLISLDEVANLPNDKFEERGLFDKIADQIKSVGYSLENAFLASQFFSQRFHQRKYYNFISPEFKLNYTVYIWKKITGYLEVGKIDRVISFNNDTLETYLIEAYCKLQKIPFEYLEHSRVRGQFWWNSHGATQPGEREFIPDTSRSIKGSSLKPIYWEQYANNNTTRNEFSFLDWTLNVFRATKLVMKLEYKRRTSRRAICNEMLASNFSYLKYEYLMIKNYRKYRKLIRSKKVNQDKLDDMEFYYFPLHFIPESTVFTSCPNAFDQLSIIKLISKELRPYEYLILKEHGQMLGDNQPEFYKEINALDNVFWIDRADPISNDFVIDSSIGVITLSGTTAFEATERGKPSLVFGYAPFNTLSSVHVYEGNLANSLHSLRTFNYTEENWNEVANYCNHFEEYGIDLDLISIFAEGENLLHNVTNPYKQQIQRLVNSLGQI